MVISNTPTTRSQTTTSRYSASSPQSRTMMTSLRLTPQSRTRLANASFLSAFLFSIFTVSYLSGQSPGRLPCPARPNGTGQRAEGEQGVDGKEIVYIAPSSSSTSTQQTSHSVVAVKQAEQPSHSKQELSSSSHHQNTEQEPKFGSISARLAYQVSKWRQSSG